jgi:hypothetical protein
MKKYLLPIFILTGLATSAQTKPKVSISGTAGVTYEGYGLTTHPGGYNFYPARRPWNLVRFNFSPTITVGGFKLPFNFNFSPMRNNFGSVPFGFGSLPGFPKQSFGQWLANPINNFGINPSYKWAELQLGTQYLKYSDLSTGDIGAFGYGFSLKPGKLRLKFFRGVSQQAFQPYTGAGTPPPFVGAYKRNITMAQIGLEKEDKYFAGFNIVKGTDVVSSIPTPLTVLPYITPAPADNLIISFNTKFKTNKGWYGQTELATTFTNRDATAAAPGTLVKDFKPFLKTNISSYRDHAIQAGFGKKGKDWDIGAGMKWLGAGYNTMGYPFVQNDRLEYTVNTKFNAFKKKTNVVASIGQRFGNWSVSANRTSQIIANINVFTQFNDHLSVNANYNNFGFNTPATLGGIKNVGNDLSINPAYTWTTSKMSNLLSLNYNWSRYTEVIIFPASTTINNTHTAMLLYAPTFFNRPNLSPDFSVMYFSNHSSVPTDIRIFSVSTSLGWNMPKHKISMHGQLQYNNTTIKPFTASNNITATLGVDWNLTKKLTWNTTMTANGNKYGNELFPQPQLLGATYLESTLRTSLQYRFGK